MRRVDCICGCRRFAVLRGLSDACYQKRAAEVKAGLTTWDQLVAEGKALPSRKQKKVAHGTIE